MLKITYVTEEQELINKNISNEKKNKNKKITQSGYFVKAALPN